MEGIVILILLALVVFIFVMPVVAVVSAKNANRAAQEALDKIRDLEARLRELRRLPDQTSPLERPPLPRAPEGARTSVRPFVPKAPESPEVLPQTPAATPPPLPAWKQDERRSIARNAILEEPTSEPTRAETIETSPPRPAFSIEQFLGVKLFAWLGGVALFFGIIFFVKYAFERDLIPPALRIAAGFATGLALLGGGWWTHRRPNYRVLAQALCATGVLVLYGVSFAAHAIYQLPLFGNTFTFALMSVVTVAAFFTAVRHDALVVAVLGMLGGFLTPVLLPLVQDHPAALFGYIAVLDAGLLALAVRGRWTFLASGAAAGTILMLVHWASRFFRAGDYAVGHATLVPMGILLGFGTLFLAAAWIGSRARHDDLHVPAACSGILATALGFAFYFLSFQPIAERAPLLYGFVLLVNLVCIVLAVLHPRFAGATLLLAGATFLHLAIWTVAHLKPDTLGTALAIYLIFGALHTLWPALIKRLVPENDGAESARHTMIAPWVPAGVIALMSVTLFVTNDVSMILWPAILVANLLAIIACARHGVVLPLLAALTITLLTAVVWLFHMPPVTSAVNALLGVVFFFALFFTGAGVWLARSLMKQGIDAARDPRKLIPLAAAVMPFLLLVLTILQVPLTNPSPVFATGLALATLLTAVAFLGKMPWLQAVAPALCFVMQAVWHSTRFDPAQPAITLSWYLGFYVVFTATPFVFRKACSASTVPWIASALTGVGHFLLVHDLIQRAFPNDIMGLVPAAFAIPALALLAIEWRCKREMDDLAKFRLAWFGGVALLFITLIFPIQLDRQWLTVAWALEGAALIWLFRHVPHKGLVLTGLGLLATSFVRLAVNPAVFTEYERGGTAILNWHLYVYGIAAAAHLIAARWLPQSVDEIGTRDIRIARGTLCCFAGVLLFLLLNIQIADFFTAPGETFITFEFTGNFARDMTYTIGWALFALATLVTGIATRTKGARYAAIGLLAATLLKLFLHDLANIGNIYRIAALLCTGVIAFIASFLYQKFVPGERGHETHGEAP
jgi:uncharacterized membrane protein